MVDQPLAPLVEQLSTGILRLDSALRVVFLNPAAEQLLGSSRKQLQGRILDKAVPSFGSLRPFLERSVRTGEGFAQRELSVEVPGPAGENTVLDCTIGEYRADRDDGLVVELTDASRRLRISRENALLSQLEASRCIVRQLAHEIRNPLGGIRGAAQLLERELPGPSLQEFTGVIIRESDRLAGLASNMLGPGAQPDRESLHIHEIVEHVFRLTSAEAATGIRVERDYDPSLPTLSLDRAQVIQALLNLSGKHDRRQSAPAGSLRRGGGHRARGAGEPAGDAFLSPHHRPARRNGFGPRAGTGPRHASGWHDRVYEPPGPHGLPDVLPHRGVG
jgi:two-component system nitrogen regulation sensor histidine kinase GlnL